ncbi:hypothetical protein BDY24DRAFT_393706 [Mrakia frigida]|uniref:uncharacterized protein n=1 Tax=Mrakia frigida TaxID=29902 RepID=UPI003FCBF906
MVRARLGVLTVVLRTMELFGEETRVMSIDEGCREEGLLRRAVSSSWGGRELDRKMTVGHVADDGEVEKDDQHETSTQPSTQHSHPSLPSIRPTIGR